MQGRANQASCMTHLFEPPFLLFYRGMGAFLRNSNTLRRNLLENRVGSRIFAEISRTDQSLQP